MFPQVLPTLRFLQTGLPWAGPHIPALALYSGWASDREPGLEYSVQVPRIYMPSLSCRLR